MNHHDKKLVRQEIGNRRGVERVRVKANGEVHALGIMPNTNRRGWYFAGYAEDILRSTD